MKRLQAIRKRLAAQGAAALLITYPVNRRYLTGFTGTSGHALISQKEAILITDGRYTTQSQQQAPDWTLALHQGAIWEEVAEQVKQLSAKSVCFEAEHISFQDFADLQALLPEVELMPTREWVEALRMQKDADEIKKMQQAATIVDQVFAQIVHEIKPGMREREVALRMEVLMRELGAEGASFETIVASGPRSALPHGLASDKKLESGELIVLDFGARYQGYTSDITRTVVLGKASEKQREIYDTVLGALQRATAQIKPGMSGRDVDAVARNWIGERGFGDYFIHATGHALGLEVHEPPSLRTSHTEPLLAGMVVTIEPGIYIPEIGGVRIEDDVLLTKTGGQRLTQAPHDLIEIACD